MGEPSGVPERTRTSDLWLRRPALYPLSYGHIGEHMVQPRLLLYRVASAVSSARQAIYHWNPASAAHSSWLAVCHSKNEAPIHP